MIFLLFNAFSLGSDTSIPVKDSTVDFIQVFQAAHWFNLPLFYSEVNRVLKPGGVLLLAAYGTGTMRPELNKTVASREGGLQKIKEFNNDFLEV